MRADRVRADHAAARRPDDLPVPARRPRPRRARPVLAAARRHRRRRRPGGADRADARGPRHRPRGDRVRHDRGGRGHDVPRRRLRPRLVATTCGRAIPGMETRIAAQTAERRRASGARRARHARLPRRRGRPPPRRSTPTAGCTPATSGPSTTDGNLTITDRLKDMYISGGFNVYPAEVEQALARLDGVADVAVVGVPDERMGEVGKAYVVVSTGSTDVPTPTTSSRSPRSGSRTSRCRGTSSSSTRCPATCPARCSRRARVRDRR